MGVQSLNDVANINKITVDVITLSILKSVTRAGAYTPWAYLYFDDDRLNHEKLSCCCSDNLQFVGKKVVQLCTLIALSYWRLYGV